MPIGGALVCRLPVRTGASTSLVIDASAGEGGSSDISAKTREPNFRMPSVIRDAVERTLRRERPFFKLVRTAVNGLTKLPPLPLRRRIPTGGVVSETLGVTSARGASSNTASFSSSGAFTSSNSASFSNTASSSALSIAGVRSFVGVPRFIEPRLASTALPISATSPLNDVVDDNRYKLISFTRRGLVRKALRSIAAGFLRKNTRQCSWSHDDLENSTISSLIFKKDLSGEVSSGPWKRRKEKMAFTCSVRSRQSNVALIDSYTVGEMPHSHVNSSTSRRTLGRTIIDNHLSLSLVFPVVLSISTKSDSGIDKSGRLSRKAAGKPGRYETRMKTCFSSVFEYTDGERPNTIAEPPEISEVSSGLGLDEVMVDVWMVDGVSFGMVSIADEVVEVMTVAMT